ncbi:Uncharacterised protein [Klebsiella pneumoniae]|uniref:Uncharacterized protein n=1 Tax=Klebsiella pneumoniae TaxID=573 RepID=A0A378FZ35_KLEPN|nr:Uncharacterised protein [Klebsiella pneumoniae]
MALPSFSGFHVTQISEPFSRTVGRSFFQAVADTDSASSTHATSMRAFDLILSRLWRKPQKT